MKIGIVGLGFMGVTHLGAFSKISGVQVTGICTTNERALSGDLSQVGGNLKLPSTDFDFSSMRKWTHWRELVLDTEFDAVDICLPTDLHPAVAIAALTAGKHVLCEKPMALTAADCTRMMAAAEEHGRVLMIGQVLRFWPEYLALRDFLQNGEGGAVRSAKFFRKAGLPDWSGWLSSEARSGGAVLDLLVHDIDQILLLFGVPETVSAVSQGEVDTLAATFSYSSGLTVTLEGGWLLPGAPFAMGFEVRRERDAIELGADGLVLQTETGGRQLQSPVGNAYEAEVEYFVECCKTGTPPEKCPPQQSAQAVAVALLLKESRTRGGEQIQCLV